jgi:large subunit ribosomal protein L35Ae
MPKKDVKKRRRGVVASYRRGRIKQNTNQVLILFDEIDTRDAAATLIGKKVKWTSESGREFLGKVLGIHGNSGVVRAKFRTNLPGQAIGTEVFLV